MTIGPIGLCPITSTRMHVDTSVVRMSFRNQLAVILCSHLTLKFVAQQLLCSMIAICNYMHQSDELFLPSSFVGTRESISTYCTYRPYRAYDIQGSLARNFPRARRRLAQHMGAWLIGITYSSVSITNGNHCRTVEKIKLRLRQPSNILSVYQLFLFLKSSGRYRKIWLYI